MSVGGGGVINLGMLSVFAVETTHFVTWLYRVGFFFTSLRVVDPSNCLYPFLVSLSAIPLPVTLQREIIHNKAPATSLPYIFILDENGKRGRGDGKCFAWECVVVCVGPNVGVSHDDLFFFFFDVMASLR